MRESESKPLTQVGPKAAATAPNLNKIAETDTPPESAKSLEIDKLPERAEMIIPPENAEIDKPTESIEINTPPEKSSETSTQEAESVV